MESLVVALIAGSFQRSALNITRCFQPIIGSKFAIT